jgi:formylmethanofuran dehydrogenase subunit E
VTTFDDVVAFHGHTCPGLALGYRVGEYVIRNFSPRAKDEELVAIVENDSCAVDAIQVLTGCTFGKGNLIFIDYGKQVYTFLRKPDGEGIRISIKWESPPETPEEADAWRKYQNGDSSEEVLRIVHHRKTKKLKAIFEASTDELFDIKEVRMEVPRVARLFPSLRCQVCGEKVMETKARVKGGRIVCIPCAEEGKL